MKGWARVAGGVIAAAAISSSVTVPLRTVDSPRAAVANYAESVSTSSGGQVRLASARVVDQSPGRANYALVWSRPDRDLTTEVVVQRRAYLGGIMASWHVVESGSAPATAMP